MKEIGGYFELETFLGTEYHDNLLALNNGRNALLYLLKARKIEKLYIPWFLCDSVSGLCDRCGFQYEYYRIDKNFMPVFDGELAQGEYLYVVNFYGQLSNADASALKARYGNVIFDNIHSFFQAPVDGIDTIYSCRKFFGVPDGAYLATNAMLEEDIPLDASKDRMKHILGRFEDNASAYYLDFKANDHSFTQLELRRMSRLTHNLLRAIDYDAVRRKRNENYALLETELGRYNGLSLKNQDGPYAYPFYCENGEAMKKALAAQGIYVATLWPNVIGNAPQLEEDYARNILPIPCDQRYDASDMNRVVDAVYKLLNLK